MRTGVDLGGDQSGLRWRQRRGEEQRRCQETTLQRAGLRYGSRANISNHSWPPVLAPPSPVLKSRKRCSALCLLVKSFSCQLHVIAVESTSGSGARPSYGPPEPFPVNTRFS